MKTLYTFDRWSCARRSIAKDTMNEWTGYHNKIVWLNFVLMQDSWQRLMSNSTSWQKTLKNSRNLQSHWLVGSTLCQEMKNHLIRKVGFEGTPKLGPYWKSQPVTCNVNMEWKSELNLWTKTILTRGSELLTWPEQDWLRTWTTTRRTTTTTSRKPLRCSPTDFRVENERICFCEPIKGQSKTHKDVLLPAHLQELYPSGKESGLILSQKIIRQSHYRVSKPLSTLLRHGHHTSRRWWSDWIVEIKRLSSERFWCNLSASVWWKCGRVKWQEAEATRKDFNIVLISSGQEILFLRALQGHSGRNLIDPSLQDNVLIPNDFFEYIYHIGCAIYFHSIMNSGLIPERTKFEQKTDGGLHVRGSYEQGTQRSGCNWPEMHRVLLGTRRARMQETSKHGENTVYWVDIKLAQKKWFKFCQTR